MDRSSASARDRTLVIERVFDAPPEIVFDAWSKPEHLMHWFGPHGFTLPFCEIDFREGGRYRICMLSPNEEEHWVWGDYQEIRPPNKLAFSWNREDKNGKIWNSTSVVLTFEQAGDSTTAFTLRQTMFDTSTDRDEHKCGWAESLERLEVFVLEPIKRAGR